MDSGSTTTKGDIGLASTLECEFGRHFSIVQDLSRQKFAKNHLGHHWDIYQCQPQIPDHSARSLLDLTLRLPIPPFLAEEHRHRS